MDNFYLEKFALRPQIIIEDVGADTSLIIVIPCFNEYNLIDTLVSLKNCDSAHGSVEVIVVINASIDSAEKVIRQNKITLKQTNDWIKANTSEKLKFFLIVENNLPSKHAGVGLARKIGMDEAVFRFEKIKNKQGVIVCLDADCNCSKNYFVEIEKAFFENRKANAASIKFEHNINTTLYDEKILKGITLYELHLRYYIEALRYAKFPFAFHTIGSCMAVRSGTYQKQGGMNKRKAGEDFYFLQKIIPLGHFIEIKSATVYPSPRVSDRVPFGTGKAMGTFLESNNHIYYSYHFKIFKILKIFFKDVPKFYEEGWSQEKSIAFFKPLVFLFLESVNFLQKIEEFKNNSTNFESFKNRFYIWFNAFMVLKFVHYMRDNGYENMNVVEAVNLLLAEMENRSKGSIIDENILLNKLRKKQ